LGRKSPESINEEFSAMKNVTSFGAAFLAAMMLAASAVAAEADEGMAPSAIRGAAQLAGL
jgi:hypothetical protein